MKRVLLMLMLVGLLGVQVQADIVLGGGDIYADAGAGNTTFADGTSPWSTETGGAGDGLYWHRTGYGYTSAGALGGDVYEAVSDLTNWRPTGPVQGLKTTVSGLVDGVDYNVYVIYLSKHIGENWNVTADFSPITTDVDGTVTSGITYGAAANTVLGVDILAGVNIDDNGGGIYSFMGLIGSITGDASGMLDVYVDDLSDISTSNERIWYDGVYLQVVPEPTTMALLGLGGLLLRRKK